jgi:hypothetical protein
MEVLYGQPHLKTIFPLHSYSAWQILHGKCQSLHKLSILAPYLAGVAAQCPSPFDYLLPESAQHKIYNWNAMLPAISTQETENETALEMSLANKYFCQFAHCAN